MGSPGPPQRTHGREDPSSTASQRDTSPALLPCGSATAWLSRLTTCSQLLLASPGQVPPKVLHVLLALTLSLSSSTSPPPHPFFHIRTRVSATKAALAPLCFPARFAGARYTCTEPVLELGHLAVRPRSGPRFQPQDLCTCRSLHMPGSTGLPPSLSSHLSPEASQPPCSGCPMEGPTILHWASPFPAVSFLCNPIYPTSY